MYSSDRCASLYSAFAALFGVWGLSVALEGWLRGTLSPALRIATGIASIALMYPPTLAAFGIGGFYLNAAAAAGLVMLFVVRRRAEERLA